MSHNVINVNFINGWLFEILVQVSWDLNLLITYLLMAVLGDYKAVLGCGNTNLTL